MPSDRRDGHDRKQHYGDRRRHRDASVCDIPHVEHSNVKSSGNMPNRAVLRTSCIGCAHFGQRGGFGADLSPKSSTIDNVAS
jgi:hypothetical protein